MDARKKQNILFGCLIAIALFAILIVVLASIKVTPLKIYIDKQFHFSLKYPEYWTVKERPQKGAALVAFLPPIQEGDKFAENVNISIFDLAREPRLTDLNAFTKETANQILGVFGDYVNVYEKKQIRMGGLPAYRFAYITLSPAAATNTKMKYLYVWTIHGRFAFILTYVGEREQFNENLKHVNRMIRTFKFEK